VHKQCYELAKQKKEIFISVLVLSEFLHRYFVDRAKSYLKAKDIEFDPRGILKAFKQGHAREYERFFQDNYIVYDELLRVLQKYGIQIIFPEDPTRDINEINELVRKYAAFLHYKYPSLDAADSFHLAIAKYSGVDNFLTKDKDFNSVTDLKIFTIDSGNRRNRQ